MLTVTKPAGVALQILGGMFVIGAVVRLLEGVSFGASIALAFGLWLMWEGRRPASRRSDTRLADAEREARAKVQNIIDRVRR